MELVELTISHYAFLMVVLSIFVSIAFRRGVIIPSIAGILILGMLSDQSAPGVVNTVIYATQICFKALLNAGKELFDIMLVISLMVAMLKSLQDQGAERIMVAPMQKLMIGPRTAFFILAGTMYLAAAFFWPTPAVALVGTVLIPVAVRVGLPALGAAVAVNLAGHGMALSADPVIQGATRLTAGAANIESNDLLPYTILFSIIVGAVAISLSFYAIRRDTKSGVLKTVNNADGAGVPDMESEMPVPVEDEQVEPGPYAKAFAIGVPVILLSIVVLMIYRGIFDAEQAIRGGDATALLGGTATVLLVLSTFAGRGAAALDGIVEHLREGFFFAIKIFAPIIPIAGFFFLGNPEHAAIVMGEGTPGFLFDIGHYIGAHMDGSVIVLSFGIMLVGLLAGMDGSGFSGLPLVGSLAGALGTGAGLNVAVLAALGQVVTIFTGGGTLVTWAFGACADAGIAGVTPAELVRRNFFPVISGLIVATTVAIFLMS